MKTAPAPFEYQLWSREDVAAYFGVSVSSIGARITSNPAFPKPISIPRADGAKLHPRWRALDVVNWALSYAPRT
jgi:predicted DNA-binding transcriptional regulator AlpA